MNLGKKKKSLEECSIDEILDTVPETVEELVDWCAVASRISSVLEKEVKRAKDKIRDHGREQSLTEIEAARHTAVFQGRSSVSIQPHKLLARLRKLGQDSEEVIDTVLGVRITDAKKHLSGPDFEKLADMSYDAWAVVKFKALKED